MTDEVHTTEKLAVRLEHIQRCVLSPDERALFVPMINQARAGYYHDYMSPIPMPDVQLVCDLRELNTRIPTPGGVHGMIANLTSEVIDGKFEATLKEGEDWLLTDAGQAALASLKDLRGTLIQEEKSDGHQA
jgi:hypothetical protein